MYTLKRHLQLILSLFLFIGLISCFNTGINKESVSDKNNNAQQIPIDSSITRDTLDNGLVYYIKKNEEPSDRLYLRLVVNAGSVLEKENERGIAHFDEHMAFNGTKHFEKDELVDYLESIGMKFGPDINASTSFERTNYRLQLPTEEDTTIEKGFQILDDWASNISFEKEEIDKERKVIHEEWRLYRSARQRVRDTTLPVILDNSKYAKRLPIGKMNVVDSCDYSVLTNFYNRWYRPDLMGVIAVGDYSKEKIENLIQEYFSDNTNPENKKERPYYDIPDHKETKYVVATDPELPRTSLTINIKHPPKNAETKQDYRKLLAQNLFTQILNNRYKKISEQADPPFVRAGVGSYQYIHATEFYEIGASLKANKIETGLESLLTEIKKINEFGVKKSELARAKKELNQQLKSKFKERDNINSRNYTREYIQNFLFGESIPGIEWEYKTAQKILPQIDINEVNNKAKQVITDQNRVITVAAPEKEDLDIPSENDLRSIVKKVKDSTLKSEEDKTNDQPLFSKELSPAGIKSKKHYSNINTTELTLSNGVKIVFKPTEFKDNQIKMRAISPGGHSLSTDSNFIAARTADDIINNSGLSDFNESDLREKLAGKKVNVSPYISSLTEGFKGSCGTDELEDLFKLTNLYFTAPRKDSTAFQSYVSKKLARIENRKVSPRAAFQDTVRRTLTQYHFRTRTPDEKLIEEMNLDSSYQFYQERFADAGDFTFFFTGNIDTSKLIDYSRKYLGNLPSKSKEEKWRDVGIDYPEDKITKTVHKGEADKSYVTLIYSGRFDWSIQNNQKLYIIENILSIMLRKKIREEEGGSYGVSCFTDISKYPDNEYKFYIFFGCSPDRAQELTQKIYDEIEKLKSEGPSDLNMKKSKNMYLKQREKDLEQNTFWVNILKDYYFYDVNPEIILEETEYVKDLEKKDIKKAANEIFGENIVEVTLYPGKDKE